MFEVWGIHPESDSEWKEGWPFGSFDEACGFIDSLYEKPLPDPLMHFEIRSDQLQGIHLQWNQN